MKTLLSRAAIGLSTALALAAHAQPADYPTQPIELIVNFGAGGNTDLAARQLAASIEDAIEQPIIIQNRPGAGGTIGPTHVLRQNNDGYTVGVVTYGTLAIAPHIQTLSYELDDFDYVAGYVQSRYGLAVRGDSPYESVQDLVEAAKQDEGIFFGSPSIPVTLGMIELGQVSDANFEEIPYKSGAETVMALLNGQVEVIMQHPSDLLPHLKSGDMRLLAATGDERWPEYPDVPTLTEQGFPVVVQSWSGLAVPKGTPQDRVEFLEAAILEAVQDEAVQDKFATLGLDPVGIPGTEFESLMRQANERMGVLIKEANIPRVN